MNERSVDVMDRTVQVSLGDRSYEIFVGPGLIDRIPAHLHRLGTTGRIGLITDTTVAKLYARRVVQALKSAGYDVHTVVLPAGERTKTMASVARVLDMLVQARFERSSLLVALGGGVIGDLTGFAAAVYLRGIPYVQVPTTLIAQVDSSVGGKTGVNHRLGKNLIGAFHQPRQVLVDVETLNSLPKREWLAGLAEVIKYGVIADEAFFALLERSLDRLLKMDPEIVSQVVTRSCEIKASVVMEDERESDRRRILNYGHTIGHALEALGRYRTWVHGEAVAIGMVQEAAVSASLGICDSDVVRRQREVIRRAGLPAEMPSVTFSALWAAMQHDKKVADGRVYCVFPEAIGRVRVAPLERQDCQTWFACSAGTTTSKTAVGRRMTRRRGERTR